MKEKWETKSGITLLLAHIKTHSSKGSQNVQMLLFKLAMSSLVSVLSLSTCSKIEMSSSDVSLASLLRAKALMPLISKL